MGLISLALYICLFALGVVAGMAISEVIDTEDRGVGGFYIDGVSSEKVVNTARELDANGEWICVNIDDMSYKRAVEICKHEVGHEIFAKTCEEDMDKCLEVVS